LFSFLGVGNFWWQLLAVGLLAALMLFAGWVQERYHWAPQEIAVEPPAHGHGEGDHGHGDGHAHPGGHPAVREDPQRRHTASHDHGHDRGGES
jgi:hypothetical protein